MNIRKWEKGEKVRYYINCDFPCNYLNNGQRRMFHNVYLYNYNGNVALVCGPTSDGSVGECLRHFLFGDYHAVISWEQWENLFSQSLTKSGNFSLSRFFKVTGQ